MKHVSHSEEDHGTRRDFLYIATGATGAIVTAAAVWPLIDQMNPDASTLALASIEVDVSDVEPGTEIKAFWRGKPVFIRRRTPEEIEEARAADEADDLKDPVARNDNGPSDAPADDANRVLDESGEWLVMVGVCTHLGCIPLGANDGNRGDFGGWFCPCHGSHYDTAGRIRKGPANQNLLVPQASFISDTIIKLG
jgi:ubiquinol-cytochrome c reductase iron-sulfur subunit